MLKTQQQNIEVYASWIGLSEPTLVGILRAMTSRGKEIFSFEYSSDWLKFNSAHALDHFNYFMVSSTLPKDK